MMKKIKWILLTVLVVCVTIGLVACGDTEDTIKLLFKQNEVTLAVGETVNLSDLMDNKGIELKNVQFASSNENVVTVLDGVIMAKGVGESVVIGKSGNKNATCKITVVERQQEEHVCSDVCPTCGACLNNDCSQSACVQKCDGHQLVPPVKRKLTEEEWKAIFQNIVNNENNYTAHFNSPIENLEGVIKFNANKSHFNITESGTNSEQFWLLEDNVVYEYNKSDNGQWSRTKTEATSLTQFGDFGIFVGEDEKYDEYTYEDGRYFKVRNDGIVVTFIFEDDHEVYAKYYEEQDGEVLQEVNYHFYDFGRTNIDLPNITPQI